MNAEKAQKYIEYMSGNENIEKTAAFYTVSFLLGLFFMIAENIFLTLCFALFGIFIIIIYCLKINPKIKWITIDTALCVNLFVLAYIVSSAFIKKISTLETLLIATVFLIMAVTSSLLIFDKIFKYRYGYVAWNGTVEKNDFVV